MNILLSYYNYRVLKAKKNLKCAERKINNVENEIGNTITKQRLFCNGNQENIALKKFGYYSDECEKCQMNYICNNYDCYIFDLNQEKQELRSYMEKNTETIKKFSNKKVSLLKSLVLKIQKTK